VRLAVSVTLELSVTGKERWFLTKESGGAPADCEEHIAGEGQGGAQRRKAYAVFKAACNDGGGHRRGTMTCFALLSGMSVEALLKISASNLLAGKELRSNECCGHFSYRAARGIMAGCFCAGQGCRVVQCAGIDARWILARRYSHRWRPKQELGWFLGVSDAVGTVELGGGGYIPWLSCVHDSSVSRKGYPFQ
jgi:hypothetical protein